MLNIGVNIVNETSYWLREEYAPNGFLASLAQDDGTEFVGDGFSLFWDAGATTGPAAAEIEGQ